MGDPIGKLGEIGICLLEFPRPFCHPEFELSLELRQFLLCHLSLGNIPSH